MSKPMKKKFKSPYACTLFWEGRHIKLDHPLASMCFIPETIRAAREEGRLMSDEAEAQQDELDAYALDK